MDVGIENSGMNRRYEKNIKFVCGIRIQSEISGEANKEWMLVLEIRVWTENPKRILSLVWGFSFKVRCWEEPIGSGCWCWKSGYGRKIRKEY